MIFDHPTPGVLDGADNGLAAVVRMDMLDRHLLLAFAAVLVEGVEERRKRVGQLVRLIEVLPTAVERLIAEHCAAIAL